MVGISSYGAYIPLWRLSRKSMSGKLAGEKAVAGFDEDSITMAVAAVTNCLDGIDRRSIDGLFFASTTSPYKEKLAATTVAVAADLRRDILTADFTNSLRAGTNAVKSAVDAVKASSAKQVLVVASDCRLGAPGSEEERNVGDGAGAILVADSGVGFTVEGSYSLSNEMLDVWRSESDLFIRSSESRFIGIEGYLNVAKEAASNLMKTYNLTAEEIAKIVISLPAPKRQSELAESLGFDPKISLQDSLHTNLGDTGAAYAIMLLVSALEEAKAGDQILLVSYGNGSDALFLKATDEAEKIKNNRGVKWHLKAKKMIPDYTTYLKWRGLLPEQRPPYPLGEIAPPAIWREVDQNLRLYGARCKSCGSFQYPPQEICIKCRTRKQFEYVRLSDKKAKLFTYAADFVTWAVRMPTIVSVVNFEGGGRLQCLMTDCEADELRLGMPVEMSFRKSDFRSGIHLYSWKAIPVRS